MKNITFITRFWHQQPTQQPTPFGRGGVGSYVNDTRE